MDVDAAKILMAVEGFLELGMPEDAAHEVERLSPAVKDSTDVIRIRAAIYHAANAWAQLEAVTSELVKREPHDPSWWINRAFAARRSTDIPTAKKILLEAELLHPENATIHFNLGCYACQLDDFEEAKRRVTTAIKLDSNYRAIALADPDLEPLWEKIASGFA